MAALIPDAQAARKEAGRLRGEALGLKLAVRQSAARSREQLRTADAALSRVQEQRYEELPSPWSTLLWSRDHEALEGVLVALP